MSLKSVGVLHFSPEDAANHLTLIWDDINDWWHSGNVQNVINDFNKQYSKYNPHVIGSISKNLV